MGRNRNRDRGQSGRYDYSSEGRGDSGFGDRSSREREYDTGSSSDFRRGGRDGCRAGVEASFERVGQIEECDFVNIRLQRVLIDCELLAHFEKRGRRERIGQRRCDHVKRNALITGAGG